ANSLVGARNQSVGVDDLTLVQTQAGLARVPAIARRVVAKVPLNMTPEQFLGASSVSTAENSDILTFKVRDPDPGLAAKAATSYAQEYVRYRRQQDTSSLKSAHHEVTKRIQQLAASGQQGSPLYSSLAKREQELRTMEALQTSNAN